MFENSGIMKNGPRQALFEADNQKVTFNDVHGVDEAKDVCHQS
jgi:ATP-dependent Zn protease